MKKQNVLIGGIVICLAIITFLLVQVYELKKELQQTPVQTSLKTSRVLSIDNYASLKPLSLNGIIPISEEEYKTISSRYKGSPELRNYELLKTNDGTMVLLHLTHQEDVEGDVKIQNIQLVPTEMHSLFK